MKTYQKYLCYAASLFFFSFTIGVFIAESRANAALADESPLIAYSQGDTAYTPISLTPVFSSGISAPKLISTSLTVDYQVQPETNFNLVRRQTTVTQVYEEYIRVGAIQ